MKLKKKQCLLLCGMLLVLIVLVTFVYATFKFSWFGLGRNNGDFTNLDQSNQPNLNSGITEKDDGYVKIQGTKLVDNIEFSNISIRSLAENKCELSADIKNTSTEFLNSTNIRIKVVNKEGQVDEIFGGILTELAGYEPGSFKTYVLADITDAIDIEIEIIE